MPAACGRLAVVMYCHPGAPRRKGAEVVIEKAPPLTSVIAGPTNANALGGALTARSQVVLHGRERGGLAYVQARSGWAMIVAGFRDLGLERGGTARITLRCVDRLPVPVLRKPEGELVGPDLEVYSEVPRAQRTAETLRQAYAPDVCHSIQP